jgi:hypothetical protein
LDAAWKVSASCKPAGGMAEAVKSNGLQVKQKTMKMIMNLLNTFINPPWHILTNSRI